MFTITVYYATVFTDMERDAPIPPIDLEDINRRITDRADAFTWQTARKISFEEQMAIWSDRHSGITSEELLDLVNESSNVQLAEVNDVKEDDQENLGFVNSVRRGRLAD